MEKKDDFRRNFNKLQTYVTQLAINNTIIMRVNTIFIYVLNIYICIYDHLNNYVKANTVSKDLTHDRDNHLLLKYKFKVQLMKKCLHKKVKSTK